MFNMCIENLSFLKVSSPQKVLDILRNIKAKSLQIPDIRCFMNCQSMVCCEEIQRSNHGQLPNVTDLRPSA